MKSQRQHNRRSSFHIAALLAVVCTLAAIVLLLAALRAGRSRSVVQSAKPDALAGRTPFNTREEQDTPAPTILTTPEPGPVFSFSPDAAYPLPQENEQLRLGVPRTLGGTVRCNVPLTGVAALIVRDYCEDPFYPVITQVSFPAGSGRLQYNLTDDDTEEGVSLASLLAFDTLKTGVHTLVLTGVCENDMQPAGEVLSVRFYVLGEEWERYAERDFSNDSYKTALAFFGGDPERFLYRYQFGYGRYTVADPEWENRYITEFIMDGGDPWLIHVDAVPYYERLRDYLAAGRVRVHGSNGDTGVLPLQALIEAYHGSYVSRFTSAKRRYVSHHAFGATTDVNAIMPPNENTPDNRGLIDHEVRDLLVYNGVQTDADGSYYDFTYSGNYPCTETGVPQTVVNYLLYELAFYRAGFLWGHYYNSTSDAMHFSLTDHIKKKHDGPKGLQKVTAYYE